MHLGTAENPAKARANGAKEIARIERGEIKKSCAATVKKLAEVLSVRPEEIADY